jgi:hypothetical protein
MARNRSRQSFSTNYLNDTTLSTFETVSSQSIFVEENFNNEQAKSENEPAIESAVTAVVEQPVDETVCESVDEKLKADLERRRRHLLGYC